MSKFDPRLLLTWYRYAPANAGSVIMTIFDASKTNSGLGFLDGVVSYRDSFGRVGQVEKKKFDEFSTRLTKEEAARVLPQSTMEASFLRFPGLKEIADKDLARKMKRKNAKKSFKSNKSNTSQKAFKPNSRPKSKKSFKSEPATPVTVIVKPRRVVPPKS